MAVCGRRPRNGQPSPAAPVLLDNMDGPRRSLQLLNAAAEREAAWPVDGTRRESFGSAAERVSLSVAAGIGASGYDLRRRPSEEFRLDGLGVVQSPGAQLAAMVVLPRSIDPETGAPRQLLVRSDKPGRGGDWEQLDVQRSPRACPPTIRVARAQYAASSTIAGA